MTFLQRVLAGGATNASHHDFRRINPSVPDLAGLGRCLFAFKVVVNICVDRAQLALMDMKLARLHDAVEGLVLKLKALEHVVVFINQSYFQTFIYVFLRVQFFFVLQSH